MSFAKGRVVEKEEKKTRMRKIVGKAIQIIKWKLRDYSEDDEKSLEVMNKNSGTDQNRDKIQCYV